MVKASTALIIVGIVFGAIVLVWQLAPLLLEKPLDVTWTDEATYFYDNYTAKIFTAIGGNVETSTLWTHDFAQELANQTDKIVHLIDVRVGMARIWWELSHSEDASNRIFPARWAWDRLDIDPAPQAAYDRLKEAEGMGVEQFNFPADWLPVDWSLEAVIYYWNPGSPYGEQHVPPYSIPDQPDCMVEVLRREAGNDTEEFRAMFANVTVKAEELAASDGVVDLADLKGAMAEILVEFGKYDTVAAAQDGIQAREVEAGCAP